MKFAIDYLQFTIEYRNSFKKRKLNYMGEVEKDNKNGVGGEVAPPYEDYKSGMIWNVK
jgi:hypothetical protein